MRLGCAALAALVSCIFLGTPTTVSAVLVPITDLTASANGWDERTEGHGCVPNGCRADLAIDDSIDYQSRWSCKASVSMVDACELTLTLAEPQDIVEIRIAFWKGDTRVRELNIFVDGVFATTIVSSGMTEGYETYELDASQASIILVQGNEPLADSGWLSITGVELMVESDDALVETPASDPVAENYLGCFADTLDDRVMFTVTTMDDLTPETCEATCAAMGGGFRYFALQQGNECWCSLCDLTDNETTTAYDRHGEGVCNAACAGESSMECGGDMAFSLYQNGSCIVTPAPTPPLPDIPENGCPDDSIPSSLEISLVWIEDTDLDLHVTEPGGIDVFYGQRTGDVGIMSPDNTFGPGSETYTLQNGLSTEDDEVLGTYSAWITNGAAGTPWVMTARIAGELVWTEVGVISEDYYFPDEDRIRYNVAVTEYAESTCDIELYGTCPEGTFSEDGTPPCVACDPGDWSEEGSTLCFLEALLYVDASEELLAAMEEDATGGFAGPGYVDLDDGRSIWEHIYLDETDGGELTVTGTFIRYDGDYYYGYDTDMGGPLPPSITLFVYLELDDGSFIRGEGEIDYSTGDFTATVTGVPNGFSTVFYSFVFLDPDDALDSNNRYGDSVFNSEVVSFQCPSPLTITLEWNTNNTDLDMQVTEPDGSSWYAWDIGTYGFGSGDVVDGFGPEIWTVIPGNPDAVGTYTVRLSFLTDIETEWKLTAIVNGEVAWIETGVYEGYSEYSYSYYYYYSSYGESETYSVVLDSVGTTSGC